MSIDEVLFAFIVASGLIISIFRHKLTRAAAITGALIAIAIYLATGWTGFLCMTAFFIMGTFSTSFQKEKKKEFAGEIKMEEKRDVFQVFANAGMAALTALFFLFFQSDNFLFIIIIASVFSSAAADTVSSELGMVWGKRFYNITSLRPGQRGQDGVISLEGTLAGVFASVIIAVIYFIFQGWSIYFLVIIVSGTIGNLSDSLLGATLERKRIIGNNMVNFLNTVIAAITSILFYILLPEK